MSKVLPLLSLAAEKLNLFSKQDRELLSVKHLPDALELLKLAQFKADDQGVDLGTGGGIPGLLLAEALPDTNWVLTDSVKKKLIALDGVIAEAGLKNASTLWGRFEELARDPDHRRAYDHATARAVKPLPILLEYATGFLKEGGWLWAWKGPQFQEELASSVAAQEATHLMHKLTHEYQLPTGETRVILGFQQESPCPGLYPRGNGIPEKKPIV